MKPQQCTRRCPGGSRCDLDDNGHTLHICRDPLCACHGAARYTVQVAYVRTAHSAQPQAQATAQATAVLTPKVSA